MAQPVCFLRGHSLPEVLERSDMCQGHCLVYAEVQASFSNIVTGVKGDPTQEGPNHVPPGGSGGVTPV